MGKHTNVVPHFVSYVTTTLHRGGFEAYLVGGCVRDLLLGRQPHDWDIATNAKPEQILAIFEEFRTVYENNFGTVTVLNKKNAPEYQSEDEVTYETAQVTTYRSEGKYSDFRRPDEVTYETKLEKDLERRDFTINAMAMDNKGHVIDPHNGQKDIKDKIINCVRNARERFQEDALRMLRAIRFSTQLSFAIGVETLEALTGLHENLKHISPERIRDEFLKIINSDNPAVGISLLERTKLLQYILPELEEGIGCEQKGEHIYDVYNHILHAFQHAADKGFNTEVRLAALLHDIGKPRTRRYDSARDKYTFYGHEVVGAKMTKAILERLKLPHETAQTVTKLVRNHMFFSDTEKITLSAVRRMIKNVGPEHIWLLMQVRECDRVGMKKKEAPYRLRKYHAMIEEALRDPITVGMLKINGERLIELGEKPGPKFGFALHALLEEVLDDPGKNTEEYLENRAKELLQLPLEDLKKLGEAGKEKKGEAEEEELTELRKKHGIR